MTLKLALIELDMLENALGKAQQFLAKYGENYGQEDLLELLNEVLKLFAIKIALQRIQSQSPLKKTKTVRFQLNILTQLALKFILTNVPYLDIYKHQSDHIAFISALQFQLHI